MTSLSQNTYLSILKQERDKPHIRNPSIHLAYENPIIHLKQGSKLEHGSKGIIAITRSYKACNLDIKQRFK